MSAVFSTLRQRVLEAGKNMVVNADEAATQLMREWLDAYEVQLGADVGRRQRGLSGHPLRPRQSQQGAGR